MERANEVIEVLNALASKKYEEVFIRFFKTAPGEYGEGDRFLGIRVPQLREVAKEAQALSLNEIQHLIHSPLHEVRECGFFILVLQFKKLLKKASQNEDKLREILSFYLKNARRANNWDLVDLSIYHIIGEWLMLPFDTKEKKNEMMDRLTQSDNLWEQRMSIVATATPIRHSDFSWIWKYATIQLSHPHDLMHKAVGWMLREMGKKSQLDLITFLQIHHQDMHRTTLRYAIERMPEQERRMWLNKKYEK